MKIKKFLFSGALCVTCTTGAVVAGETFTSCGPGYVLAVINKLDGINALECQKLWCRDLENGKSMGAGNTAANGYKATGGPVKLCDAKNNCVECFGDRKWCTGDVAGIWEPEMGRYTRGGDNKATNVSFQSGSCFSWRLGQPDCASGSAILKNGEWVCVVSSGTGAATRESAVRRTGTVRKAVK